MDSAISLHLVVLPWVGFSHHNPFLELSKRIAQLGHRISFLSTPTHIQNLAFANPGLPPFIDLVALRHPGHAADGHPEECLDALEAPLAEFLRRTSPPPDWILFDSFPYWVPRVAAGLGVPCAYVSLIGAAANAFMWPAFLLATGVRGCHVKPEVLVTPPAWAPFATSLAYRRYEAMQVLRDVFEPKSSGASGAYRLGSSIFGCDAVAVRSCPEFEPEWLALLGRLYDKPVLPLGHFPPAATEDDIADSVTDSNDGFKWLGKREVGSVVYVAFASELQLTREQVREVADGLELSNLPFIWPLRTDPDPLLLGFEERTRGRGLVCSGRVPQLKILAHPSVGGFMTHCGWNSLVEALQFGLALVLLPLANDEGLNARLMAERKVGVEVPRRDEDGAFVGVDVARTLRLVMVDKEGEVCRARAKELKDVLRDRDVHDRHVKNFVEFLKENRRRE